MKIHTKSLRKEIEAKLDVYTIQELITECRCVIVSLRDYPEDNKWQLSYYKKFWNLLLEY